MRVLVVEDEPRMANVIAKGLREQSYAVDVAQDGEAGLYQAEINDYDMIVLDVVRKRLPSIPVLFLETGYHFAQTYEYRDRMAREREEEQSTESVHVGAAIGGRAADLLRGDVIRCPDPVPRARHA